MQKQLLKFSGAANLALFLYFILNTLPKTADTYFKKKIFKQFTLLSG